MLTLVDSFPVAQFEIHSHILRRPCFRLCTCYIWHFVGCCYCSVICFFYGLPAVCGSRVYRLQSGEETQNEAF